MQVRGSESQKSWFRTERFYHTGDGWWFSSREHTEEGPFSTLKDAEMELIFYIRKVNLAQSYLN